MHARKARLTRLMAGVAAASMVMVVAGNPAESKSEGAMSVPATAPARKPGAEIKHRPNIIVILADDLGYSDLGAFGGEIATPNLDALARRGVKMTQFYVAPTCSPTRSMLLTGLDHHQAGLGTMRELLGEQERGKPGYEGYVPPGVPMLPEQLRAAGYSTFMAGKWHLGLDRGAIPADRGFESSFALLQGAHNHFGNDQSSAYRAAGLSPTYMRNDRQAAYPVGEFSADYFTSNFLDFMDASAKDKPFFGYLAFTSPHWPIQAPAETIAKYAGSYNDGPEALARQRVARMKKMGLINKGFERVPIDDGWDKQTPDEKRASSRRMEIYAAMVDRLDQNVGRVINALEASGRLENTVIFFLSDNGPDGFVIHGPARHSDPTGSTASDVRFDNSMASLGSGESYTSYGPLWAAAGSAPYRGIKTETFDGGIHSPMIVAGPGVQVNCVTRATVHVNDLLPTLLSIAGVTPASDRSSWMARYPGASMTDLLAGRKQSVHADGNAYFWELAFRRAIRQGRYKATFQPTRVKALGPSSEPGTTRWQLFDISSDPGETTDISSRNDAVTRDLADQWYKYAAKNNVIVLNDEEGADYSEGNLLEKPEH